MKNIPFVILLTAIIVSCTTKDQSTMNSTTAANINELTQTKAINLLVEKYGNDVADRAERGVKHAASLWRSNDGTPEEFQAYCNENFVADESEREFIFRKISRNLEILYGYFNQITVDLNKPIHEPMGETHKIDGEFGAYSAGAHLIEDMYNNKLAFYIALNFPYYLLKEKEELGKNWTRKEWAYARMGDIFTSRIPSELIQNVSKVSTETDMYISEYNIYAGKLTNDKGDTFFPEDMILLTHWNLRDEIKANYSDSEKGLEKQAMIYQVMKRIIDQSIPEQVINNGELNWDPYSNKVYENGSEISVAAEPDTRYQQLLDNFHSLKALDEYSPLNTAIRRAFEGDMEISQATIENLFMDFLSSKEVKQVGELISQRLGRELKPWDIWYDGFKARSNLDENMLNSITEKKYPNAGALDKDLPNILVSLGFDKSKANYLSDKIVVDPARGSGHAWGAQRKGDVAHLRTRIPESGMNYKGYNIAVHEFGHNVEQTLSLYDIDYYMLNGVPSTAFTEALAFIFQKRDLEILGINNEDSQKEALTTLDNFWSTVEIMGVSILDQRVWKWMYENPEATPAELKAAVISMAKEIWNEFFAPVFGSQDEPILAVYSHMISYPLYLSNYAVGNLIEFQVEEHLKSADFANEVERIYTQGRLTPNAWMQGAVKQDISTDAIIKQAGEAVQMVQ